MWTCHLLLILYEEHWLNRIKSVAAKNSLCVMLTKWNLWLLPPSLWALFPSSFSHHHDSDQPSNDGFGRAEPSAGTATTSEGLFRCYML